MERKTTCNKRRDHNPREEQGFISMRRLGHKYDIYLFLSFVKLPAIFCLRVSNMLRRQAEL